MSDVVRRTIFWYRDGDYIKFLPFCRVNVGGKDYIEPWDGLVLPQYKAPDVNFKNWDPKDPARMITAMEECDPDFAASAIGGGGGDMPITWGTPNTKVGK